MTLLVALGAGFAFGLVPTLQARRLDLQDALKGRRQPGGARARRADQPAVGAGRVGVRAGGDAGDRRGAADSELLAAASREPGVRQPRRAQGGVSAPAATGIRSTSGASRISPRCTRSRTACWRERRACRACAAAAIAGNHPIDPGYTNSFSVVGREAESRSFPEVSIRRVTPGYFATMGVPLVRGRLLRDCGRDARRRRC